MKPIDMVILVIIYLISITYLLNKVWNHQKIQDVILVLTIGTIFVISCITGFYKLIILSDLIGLSKILYDLSVDSKLDY